MSDHCDPPADHLSTVLADLRASGVADQVSDLVRRVWRSDVDRFEPEHLGDNATSLGVQAATNLRELALRLWRDDPTWAIPGLEVTAPHSSLQLSLNGAHIRFMKAPPSAHRVPSWADFNWESVAGLGRREWARENTRAVGGRRYEDRQLDLFNSDIEQPPQHFLLIWSGELNTARTAGWLTLPRLGEMPFLAVAPLWFDEKPKQALRAPVVSHADGKSFDAHHEPSLTLRMKTSGYEAQS